MVARDYRSPGVSSSETDPASTSPADEAGARRSRGRFARALRRIPVVALVIVLLLLMVVSAGLGTVVWLVNRPVDDRSHDLQSFDEAPERDPIERLGRWDGTAWVPVAADSIPPGQVTVLVHGLAQGAKSIVEAHPGPAPLLSWDAIRADGHHQFGWVTQLAKAAVRDDPNRVVLAYSWIDDSAIDGNPLNARYSQARTELNGHRLAAAIDAALPPSFSITDNLQLIGHSHGARVATVAAVSLDESPAHLVLLDSPDNLKAQIGGANNNLAPLLRRLDLGPDGTFVDNYLSSYGVPYGDMPGLHRIADIKLDPGRDLFGATGHAYPPTWYQHSATALAEAAATPVGFAWSPLRLDDPGFRTPPRGADLAQDWLRNGEPVPSRELNLKSIGQHHGPARQLQQVGLDAHDGDAAPDDNDVVRLSEDGTKRWNADFEVDDDDVAIELTYQFTDPGDGDQLGIWIDGQLRMVTVGMWAGSDPQTVALDVANVPAGTHNLTLAVRAFGEANADVEASAFKKLATPGLDERTRGIARYVELGAVVVFVASAAGLVALFVHRRRRRRLAG